MSDLDEANVPNVRPVAVAPYVWTTLPGGSRVYYEGESILLLRVAYDHPVDEPDVILHVD